jgi:hypothetical protein
VGCGELPYSFRKNKKQKIFERLAKSISTYNSYALCDRRGQSLTTQKQRASEQKSFYALVKKAFTEKKKRLATKPSKASKERKLGEKKVRGCRLKQTRKRVTKED